MLSVDIANQLFRWREKNIQDLYFVRFFSQPYQRPEAIKIRYKQDSPWFGESVSTIHKYTGTNTQIASKASFGKWSFNSTQLFRQPSEICVCLSILIVNISLSLCECVSLWVCTHISISALALFIWIQYLQALYRRFSFSHLFFFFLPFGIVCRILLAHNGFTFRLILHHQGGYFPK